MTTEQQLLDSAASHARATSISWSEYLRRVHTQPDYEYEQTEWFRAGADLQSVKTLPPPTTPPANYLAAAQARIFLAQSPLDALAAPPWMVPVCTADLGYREWYDPGTIEQLRDHFDVVESWCDCRDPTAYSEALRMVDDLDLDGAWGQCETTAEFDHAYANGADRMVGSVNAAVLDAARLELVADAEVLLSVEIYCNKDRNLQPDWRNANAGIGGNCIAVYESADEGAIYTPVAWYRERGFYVPKRDSVYGVGLSATDWADLA